MKKGLIFLLSFLSLNGYAQQTQKEDSLLSAIRMAADDTNKVHLYLGMYYAVKSPERQIKYGTAALELAQKIQYKKGIAAAHNNIGLGYMDSSYNIRNSKVKSKAKTINTALFNFYAARDTFEQIGDKHGVGGANCNIGFMISELGEKRSDIALGYLMKAKQLLYEINDTTEYLPNTLAAYGLVYYHQKYFDLALQNFYIAKAKYQNINDQRKLFHLIKISLFIARAFGGKHQYEQAMSYATDALQHAKELNDPDLISEAEKCITHIEKKG